MTKKKINDKWCNTKMTSDTNVEKYKIIKKKCIRKNYEKRKNLWNKIYKWNKQNNILTKNLYQSKKKIIFYGNWK